MSFPGPTKSFMALILNASRFLLLSISLPQLSFFPLPYRDPVRLNTFVWVAPPCLSPRRSHAATEPRNACLTFTCTQNGILPFL